MKTERVRMPMDLIVTHRSRKIDEFIADCEPIDLLLYIMETLKRS